MTRNKPVHLHQLKNSLSLSLSLHGFCWHLFFGFFLAVSGLFGICSAFLFAIELCCFGSWIVCFPAGTGVCYFGSWIVCFPAGTELYCFGAWICFVFLLSIELSLLGFFALGSDRLLFLLVMRSAFFALRLIAVLLRP
jgi:hypothetical protein